MKIDYELISEIMSQTQRARFFGASNNIEANKQSGNLYTHLINTARYTLLEEMKVGHRYKDVVLRSMHSCALMEHTGVGNCEEMCSYFFVKYMQSSEPKNAPFLIMSYDTQLPKDKLLKVIEDPDLLRKHRIETHAYLVFNPNQRSLDTSHPMGLDSVIVDPYYNCVHSMSEIASSCTLAERYINNWTPSLREYSAESLVLLENYNAEYKKFVNEFRKRLYKSPAPLPECTTTIFNPFMRSSPMHLQVPVYSVECSDRGFRNNRASSFYILNTELLFNALCSSLTDAISTKHSAQLSMCAYLFEYFLKHVSIERATEIFRVRVEDGIVPEYAAKFHLARRIVFEDKTQALEMLPTVDKEMAKYYRDNIKKLRIYLENKITDKETRISKAPVSRSPNAQPLPRYHL